jgi:hypothetical protein
MTVNEECGVEVDCSSVRFMLSSAEKVRVFRKLKMEGNTDTNADGIFILCGIFYLTFVPYRK